MTFAQFGRQQIGQLDLADLAFDLGVGHRRLKVMLEACLAEERDEKFLRQINISVAAFCAFDEETRAVRSAHERVATDDAVEFCPQARDIRAAQGLNPLCVAAARGAFGDRRRRGRSSIGSNSRRRIPLRRRVQLFFGSAGHGVIEWVIMIGRCCSHVIK